MGLEADIREFVEKMRKRSEELYEEGEFVATTELRTFADHIEAQVNRVTRRIAS